MHSLVMVGQLGLALAILVFIHELGHFLAARAFGIRVDKFFIFFDFGGIKLFSKKVGNTEYGVGWFPLGGYVKIAGMIDESMDKEYLDKEPESWEFRSKPAWQRFIVMIAGITMNVILGIFIFTFWLLYFQKSYVPAKSIDAGIYAYELGREIGLQTGDQVLAINGRKVRRVRDVINPMKVVFGSDISVERNGEEKTLEIPDGLYEKFKRSRLGFFGYDNFTFKVDSVLPDKPAAEADLEQGDKIVAVNDDPVPVFGKFRETLNNNLGQQAELTVVRNSDTLMTSVHVDSTGTIGIMLKGDREYDKKDYTLANAIYYGTRDGFEYMYFQAIAIARMATLKLDPREMDSLIGMAKVYGPVWDWNKFWFLTGLISFILAFMNILPIPALDGGHVMFILIEVIQGKPVSEKVMEKAQIVGMIILMALMIFFLGNDIFKHFLN